MSTGSKSRTYSGDYTKVPAESLGRLPSRGGLDSPTPRRRNAVVLGLLGVVALALLHCSWTKTKPAHPYYARPDVPLSASSAGPRNPAHLIEAEHGAVASENELCSQTGIKVLKDGGNAVDAAIAATLCIGVTNMFSCVYQYSLGMTYVLT